MSERTLRRNAERSGYRLHIVNGIYVLADKRRVLVATRSRNELLAVIGVAA